MKRFLGMLTILALALVVAGCGSSGTKTGTGESTSTPAGTETVIPVAKSWTVMPMGVQEKASLAAIERPVGMYVAGEKKAHRKPAALDGKTPRFVGYQVQIWSKQADGKFQSVYIDVIGGRIDALGDVTRPLEAKMVQLHKDQTAINSSKIVAQSTGEKAAVAKALAWADQAFPGAKWSAQIAAYNFYYSMGGKKYVHFTAYAGGNGYRAIAGPMVAPAPNK